MSFCQRHHKSSAQATWESTTISNSIATVERASSAPCAAAVSRGGGLRREGIDFKMTNNFPFRVTASWMRRVRSLALS